MPKGQNDPEQAENGASGYLIGRFQPKEEPIVQDIEYNQKGKNDGNTAGHQVFLCLVKKHVVSGEHGQSLEHQPKMLSQTKFHAQSPNPTPSEEQQGRQGEAVSDRDLTRNTVQLQLYSEPGGAPDEHHQGVDEERPH